MDYNITTEPVFGPLEKIDWNELATSRDDAWWHRTACRVNESCVRIGVFQGEFHWHSHEVEDEYFHVLSGRLLLDFEENTVSLKPGEAMVVPKGTLHRTRAEERSVVLMVSPAQLAPKGD